MLNYQNDSNIRLIKNNTGADVGQYEVLKIDGPVFTPTDNATGWLQRQTFKGATPTADCDFAITQRAVPNGKTQPALMSGVTPCTIEVSDASHTHAVAGTTAAKLVSAASGPAKILWKESGTGTKNAVVQLSQGGGGISPVIGRHLDCQRKQFRGVAEDPYSGSGQTQPCAFTGQLGSNVQDFINESNDRNIIGPSGTGSRWAIKKAGVYAYSIPWAIRIKSPGAEVASVGPLLTDAVEFSYDGSGHVDGIRNATAASGNQNPKAFLYRYPSINIFAFLYDSSRATRSIEAGFVFGSDKGGGGFNTVFEGVGTDSNGDAYGPLWEYYLGDDDWNVISNGCISGAFSISQDAIDNLSGGASMAIDFKWGDLSSTAEWEYAFGGFVIYSPLIGDMASNYVGTIFPNSGVQPLG